MTARERIIAGGTTLLVLLSLMLWASVAQATAKDKTSLEGDSVVTYDGDVETWRGELDSEGGSVVRHTVYCQSRSSGARGYNNIHFYSYTTCSHEMQSIRVISSLQQSFGSGSSQIWVTVAQESESCDGAGCNAVFARGIDNDPTPGTYRVAGEHWVQWPLGHSGTTYGETLSAEFSYPGGS